MSIQDTVDVEEIVDGDGTRRWLKDAQLHRDGDLPALECPDGVKYWYRKGIRHRDGDKPALIEADGEEVWYQKGSVYRDGDLPTCVKSDGSVLYGMRSSQKYTVEETVLSVYGGVEYSVPHWLSDGYSASREADHTSSQEETTCSRKEAMRS